MMNFSVHGHEYVLYTERTSLRPWREEDAAALYRLAREPRVGMAAGWPPHRSEAESREVIRTVFAVPEIYAVVLKATDEPVGCAGLMMGDNRRNAFIGDDEAEVGYWLGLPYWGRGLATEVVGALLRHAFEDLRLRSVWGGCYEANVRSRRVLEKCGFGYQFSVACDSDADGESTKEMFTKIGSDVWRNACQVSEP